MVCASRKNKLETEGGSRVKGDSNTIPKRDFICSNDVWKGFYTETRGIQDFRGHWQMAVGVRNHSTRVYLCPTDCHTAVLCSPSRSVQAVGHGCLCLRKCTLAGLQKQHRGFRIHPNMFFNLLRPSTSTNWVKVSPGSGAIFLGSPEITLSDLTETQRKAFRVQVWLHQFCINGLMSGQRGLRKVRKIWGFGITAQFLRQWWVCFSQHSDTMNIRYVSERRI